MGQGESVSTLTGYVKNGAFQLTFACRSLAWSGLSGTLLLLGGPPEVISNGS
jgi:hypothetical protein